MRDCGYFLWHPVYFFAALIANTPARFCAIDFIAFVFLLTASAGFVCLAHQLRREWNPALGDGLLTFFTQSFTYSMIVLCIGPSWVNFLGNHSALPWLALGIVQTSWRRGLGLVGFFALHNILGGQLQATISTALFLSLFAAGVGAGRRSWLPLLVWVGGNAIALVLLLPLLIPAAEGFSVSFRGSGLVAAGMAKFAMPATLFPFSYFLSVASVRLHIHYVFGDCQPYYSAAFASCAAAWALIPALASRTRWRALEILCLCLAAFAILLVIRPAWTTPLLSSIPLLRSMRWPFREIVELQFFLHLFFVLRPMDGSPWFRRGLLSFGALIFLAPLPFLPAPSFNPMTPDRFLLFSGNADLYWAKVKTLLGPDDVIVSVADPDLVIANGLRVPFTLLGAGNYPALFQVRAGAGYSPTAPRNALYIKTEPAMIMGIFDPRDKDAIRAERPNVRFITLESVDPLRITLSSKTGPALLLIEIPVR